MPLLKDRQAGALGSTASGRRRTSRRFPLPRRSHYSVTVYARLQVLTTQYPPRILSTRIEWTPSFFGVIIADRGRLTLGLPSRPQRFRRLFSEEPRRHHQPSLPASPSPVDRTHFLVLNWRRASCSALLRIAGLHGYYGLG